MTSRRCGATRADGWPCQAWAVRATDPPRCAAHGGTPKPIGAPPGNTNALKHGFYAQPDLPEDCTIDAIIEDLYAKQTTLSQYIQELQEEGDLTIDQLAHLLRIHGMNASRLGRLLRDRRALSGEAADGISGAIAQALDELSTELGAEL
jgi:hypothetical protein